MHLGKKNDMQNEKKKILSLIGDILEKVSFSSFGI